MLRFSMTVLVAAGVCLAANGETALSKEEAKAALKQAVDFFRTEVSCEGGYLWRYTADLSYGQGEGRASKTTVWVQPPGTPSVGFAYLSAYERTGDAYLLEAATETAHALVKGQLVSGGWAYNIGFAPEQRDDKAYRGEANPKGDNTTTLDDNTTQSALRLLMRVDEALDFKDEAVHEAAMYALDKLLAAQYPNGAWPQRFVEPPDPAKHPVKAASYPDAWSREYPGVDYRSFYTFNDNTISDVIETMFEAGEIYEDTRYRAAALKGGDFMLLAQMPEPQPGWAQQYDADMQPAWARKFEPPAITGGESGGVLRTLLQIYRETGDKKYLEPVPRALEYYKNSELPGGKLARFYELKTNKPLYFTKDYKLTYSSDDMPTHYSFIGGSWVHSIEAEYQRVLKMDLEAWRAERNKKREYKLTPELKRNAGQVVGALDERGAWVEKGDMRYYGEDDPTTEVIDCGTFAKNVSVLSQFIAASE